MKRLTMAMLALGLAPLLMGAGGGANPPVPGTEKIAKSPHFKATITLDTHPLGSTSTAGAGTVTIRQDSVAVTSVFQASFATLQGFSNFGCVTDLGITEGRFVNTRLVDLMGPLATIQLFGQLGIQVAFDGSSAIPLRSPIITKVSNPRCSGPADPLDQAAPGPGIQIFDAQLQFVVPD